MIKKLKIVITICTLLVVVLTYAINYLSLHSSLDRIIAKYDSKIHISKLQEGSNEIVLTRKSTIFPNIKESPKEVESIFGCYMYLHNKSLLDNISSIKCIYTSGGIDNCNYITITINKSEFETIRNKLNIESSEKNNYVPQLTKLWCDSNCYYREGLTIPDDESYKKQILTPYNNWIINENGNYGLYVYYSNDNAKISVLKVDKSSTQNLWESDKILNTKILYVTWDGNNFWVVNEKRQITFYENRNNNWYISDYSMRKEPVQLKLLIQHLQN